MGRSVAKWIRWGGPVVLIAAVLLYIAVYRHWPGYFLQIDVRVYRFGGLRVLHGLDLYSIGRNGATDDLLFTYTPFAALVFTPLAFVTDYVAQISSIAVTAVVGVYAVWRMLTSLGVKTSHGLWGLTALLVGLLSWLEPIRLTIQLGQINVIILAVVVADILSPATRRWAGIGIGVVAGIKLTPAIFIIYLVLIGRIRAAFVATATGVATVLIGLALLPSASRFYWFDRAFDDVKRITRFPPASTSLRGMILRLDYPTWIATALAVVVFVASLTLAVRAYRRGYALLGISLVGMASCAVSPFSWSHHWVWFAPLVVHLAYRGYVLGSRLSAWTMWAFCAAFAGWMTTLHGATPDLGLVMVHPGGVLDDLMPSIYVFVLVAVLVCTAVWLRGHPVHDRDVETHTATPVTDNSKTTTPTERTAGDLVAPMGFEPTLPP